MTMLEILSGLGLLAVLIVLNGLFVAAEYALVSIRKSRVEEMVQNKAPQSGTIKVLKTNIDRSIAGSQLGITLASLLIGWIGGDSILNLIKAMLSAVGLTALNPPASLAVILSFVLLSLMHVIIGEQIPKQIALRLPEKVLVLLAAPFRLFCWIATPFVWLMSVTSGLVLKLFGIQKAEGEENHKLPSPDEFQILFEESEKAGTLGKTESDLLKRALELKALAVRDVMVPRTRIDCIPDDLALQAVLAIVSKTKHSKLPVFRGNRDTIVGILHTRDLYDLFHNTLKSGQTIAAAAQQFNVTDYVRKPYYAPDSMLASTLLEEMRKHRLQMAIVVDEFGSTVGLVTMEDLLEQLVGEIQDEYDKPHLGIEQSGEGVWKVNGEVTVLEFNKSFETTISCTVLCTTIAGAVIEALDRQPVQGDSVQLGNYKFTVLERRGQAIAALEVRAVTPQVPTGGEATESVQDAHDGHQQT